MMKKSEAIKELPMKECDGNCDERNDGHKGEVIAVRVHGRFIPEPGLDFQYCQAAIEEDCKNGFLVEIL